MKRMLYPWEGKNSIRFKLALGAVLIVTPLLGLLYYYNFYAVRVVHHQVSVSNRNMVSLYMHQIDNGLDTVDQYLLGIAAANYDIKVMESQSSQDEYMLAKLRLINTLTGDLLQYKSVVNSLFVYAWPQKEIADSITNVTDQEYTQVSGYITKELFRTRPSAELGQGWFVRHIEGSNYLFRLLKSGDTYVGAWVNLHTLVTPLALIDMGPSGVSVFLDDSNRPLSSGVSDAILADMDHQLRSEGEEGSGQKYLIVKEHSSKGNISLAAIIPTATVLQNLPYLNRIVIIITVIFVLMVPVFFLFLRNVVLQPLYRLMKAMKRIREGNLQTRIQSYRTSDEFMLVHATFNQMMEQMEELKIHVYEEQLNKQKAELQHLQLQINPHFFMNTLNLIYSLALEKDYELIKEMTLRLVRYFRYMFRSNLTFVTLKDELEHVSNYIGIHELRYQQEISYRLEVPDRLRQVPVPPLIIQSFVENALKHGYRHGDSVPVVIEVCVELDESEAIPYMVISVIDEGKGFRETELDQLNSGEKIVDEQGNDHIGIWNVWHRLRILYGNNAQLNISNAATRGAVVRLKLPMQINNQPSEEAEL